MQVSLVSGENPDGVSQAVAAAGPQGDPEALLRSLTASPHGSEAAPAHATTRSAESLTEILDEQAARRGEASATATPADHGAQPAAAASAAAGALWGVVEPCWKGMGVAPGAIVRLEIDLDSLGRLRSPPKIIRGGDTILGRRQLDAEGAAIQALSSCLPRAPQPFTGRFVLDFRRS